MTRLLDPMLAEFQEEAAITKRILDRVPGDKLEWRPHAKSMTLGQLCMHIAMIPGNLSRAVQGTGFDIAERNINPPAPASAADIHTAFETSVAAAEACLSGMSDEDARQNWRLLAKGREIFSKPRTGILRTLLFNHWYHHRGQLSVYLRLLDVPVPVVYGRSADENPFA